MKTCFKCGESKPFTDFYRHPKMSDGYLGKCKACACAEADARRQQKLQDPTWVERELARSREKQRRRRAMGLERLDPQRKREADIRHAARYPEKHAARLALSNAIRDGVVIRKPCEVCGDLKVEGHHDDYSKPLDVTWLCSTHHAARHVEMRREKRSQRSLTCEATK